MTTHIPGVTLRNKKGANNGHEDAIQDQQIFVLQIASNVDLGPSQHFMQQSTSKLTKHGIFTVFTFFIFAVNEALRMNTDWLVSHIFKVNY